MKLLRLLPVPAALLAAAAATAGAPSLVPGKTTEFLPVDQAFELQPLELRDGRLRVEWRIAKGYYLYKDRLKFMLETGTQPAAPALPKPEKHHDEYFGDSDVYRSALVAVLPPPAAPGPVKLTVVYQGCADRGLCYPPQTRTLELAR